jgi:hypothetical protein
MATMLCIESPGVSKAGRTLRACGTLGEATRRLGQTIARMQSGEALRFSIDGPTCSASGQIELRAAPEPQQGGR